MQRMKQTAMRIYGWLEFRLQLEGPVKDAVLHPVPRECQLVVCLRQWRLHAAVSANLHRHFVGVGLCAFRGRGME